MASQTVCKQERDVYFLVSVVMVRPMNISFKCNDNPKLEEALTIS